MSIKENIIYTLKHKKAFLKVEKELTGKNSISGYCHDIDKIFLYLITSKKKTSQIHRWWSKHHMESFWKNKDWKCAIIDWECSRITKKDKPLNARKTMEKYYLKYKEHLEPILKKYYL